MSTTEDILARVYPTQVAYLQKLIDSGKIHHTYGFVGVLAGAQNALAEYTAMHLLGSEHPLSQHPDFLRVSIAPDENSLGVEDAKRVRDHVLRRPLLSAYRVVFIERADMLTTAAANALLKLLEEPPSFAVILCATSAPYLLPATVRSRMQFVHVSAVSLEQTVGILRDNGIPEQQLPEAVDAVQGRFEQLLHVIAGDEVAQAQAQESAFWLSFLGSSTAERDRAIQQYLGTGEESQVAAHTIAHVLEVLESLLHGAIASRAERTDLPTIPSVARKRTPLDRYSFAELRERVVAVQRLREMTTHNVQKKMLFDYLTIAL